MRHVAAAAVLLAGASWAAEPGGGTLREVTRIHVERLSGGETADQIRDMIISCIERTGLFLVTEDPERADAVLRGSAEDLIYNETHELRDGVDARGGLTVGRPSTSRSSRGFSVNSSVGESESSSSVERRHEAMAAVRLVNRQGDVIWSTVQESKGAKFASASMDVAERVSERLAEDYRKPRQPETAEKPEE